MDLNAQPIAMNPELVYGLVSSNPGLKNLVEQTAKLQQLQQMAQNPMGTVNSFLNWQGQQAPAQNQQGGQPMGMFDQAMGIVEEFRKSFEVVNNNLKEVYDMCASNAEEIKEIKALSEKADLAVKPKNTPKPE